MIRLTASNCLVRESALFNYRNYAAGLFLLLCFGFAPAFSYAQSVTVVETGVSAQILEGRIQEVDASSTLDEADQSALLDLYRKSLGLINQRSSYESRVLEFTDLRETAPNQASNLREQLELLEARKPPSLPTSLQKKLLSQLEQLLLSEKAYLSGLGSSLAEAAALLEAQSLRSQQVRERLEQVRLRQAEINEAMKTPKTPGQSQRRIEARQWAWQLEARTLAAETDMLNQDLLSQPMRIELYGVQHTKASKEWERQQRYVELIGILVGERRAGDAERLKQDAEEVERQSFGKHQLVQELAKNNTLLTGQLE
jgi:potassium efflux system protein